MFTPAAPGSRTPVCHAWTFILAALALFFLAQTQAQAGEIPEIPVVTQIQTYDGITPHSMAYKALREDCTITWIAFYHEPGVVKYQPDCAAPLAEQVPILRSICSVFLSKDPNAAAFRTLFWGRLAPDGKDVSREMSQRLVAAAFNSGGWDTNRGQPKNDDINGFTRDLANQAGIYPELRELFRDFNLAITLSHAEKVLVVEAGQLPFFPELAELGIGPTDRLPFDFMAWFAITSLAEEEKPPGQ